MCPHTSLVIAMLACPISFDTTAMSASGQHQRRGAVPQSVEASRRQLLTRPTGQPLKVAEWLRSLTNRGPRSLGLDVRIEPISARPPLTSQGLKEDEDRVKYHGKALE